MFSQTIVDEFFVCLRSDVMSVRDLSQVRYGVSPGGTYRWPPSCVLFLALTSLIHGHILQHGVLVSTAAYTSRNKFV